MRLGLFMMPVHPPERPFAETLAEDTAKSLLAEELGFDELWLGEHFSATSEPIPAPLMFFAGLLARTRRLRFGTAVINLPNHHPAVVAAEVAQFDQMSRGRLMLGIGAGGLASDHELFDAADPAVRGRKLLEAVDMIQRIWAQDPPYDLAGEFWTVRITKAVVPELGIGFMPKPFQSGGPPISISLGSPDSASARLAAARGWEIISGNAAPLYSVASHWAAYRAACEDAGRPASGDAWRVARNVLVAPTDAEARERAFDARGANRYFYTYMRTALARAGRLPVIKPRPELPDDTVTVEAITEECVLYGSPRTLLDRLIAFRERVGPFGTLLMTGLDWSGPNQAWEREAMRLLAQDVMPKLRQHLHAQAAE
jgi:alkanesulfonate monooxygenase SsuD/methylene tetrahydromethanopterin reductase-like flavin-dependent oxidoreductase (luciferase family)